MSSTKRARKAAKPETQAASQPNLGGRPTKLNADRQKKICDAILVGATYEAAAQHAGIDYQTFRNWMKQGEADAVVESATPFFEFFEAIQTANADAQVFFALNIKDAARGGDWRAAAWMLERRFPKHYGQRTMSEMELTGKDGGPIQVQDPEQVRIARLKQFAPVLAAALAEQNADPSPSAQGEMPALGKAETPALSAVETTNDE